MAEIKVTSTTLRSTSDQLRQQISQLKSTIEQLAGTEQTLMGQWDGEAKETFHNAFLSDKGQMETFCTVFETFCQALNTIADGYEKAEQSNTSTASARTYH